LLFGGALAGSVKVAASAFRPKETAAVSKTAKTGKRNREVVLFIYPHHRKDGG
jgi:hypothetical protein